MLFSNAVFNIFAGVFVILNDVRQNVAVVEKSIDVRENDKDVREIDIHLAEVLRLIDPFDFATVRTLRIATAD